MKKLSFITDRLEQQMLSAAEHRVYCHILNRSRSGESTHTEAISTTAKTCMLNQHTVRNAISLLTKAKMIRVEFRPGQTNKITPTSPEDWLTPEEVITLKEAATPSNRGQGTPSNTSTPNTSTPSNRGTSPLLNEDRGPLLNEAPKDTKNTKNTSLSSNDDETEGDCQGDIFSGSDEQIEEQKAGNELWDFEFETEFWPKAFKKVSVGKARESYRAARKKASRKKIFLAWQLVNDTDFPAKAEEDGSKAYVPMPSTWLNQERWEDEGIVARLEEANSPEAVAKNTKVLIGHELARLNANCVVPERFRGAPMQQTVSQLDLASAEKYLEFLRLKPTPKPLEEGSYVAA